MTLKIAVATDDGKTITQHFGRASSYLIFTIEDGEIVERTVIEKPGHRQFAHGPHDDQSHENGHGSGAHSTAKHSQMIEPIRDPLCAIMDETTSPTRFSIQV